MFQRIEELYGASLTYISAGVNVGVGVWSSESWFLILSAIAVLIRIGIDVPQFIRAWRKKDAS